MPGESPPPPPRVFYGRDKLIERIVGLAENLDPIALIGSGGIGKTSIALAVLHHDRIKQRFGDNRRFVRCDQFQATQTHFLHQLSYVTGAGVRNPENLAPIREFLSSKKTLIILDNAESILDPQGTSAEEIYAVVEELSQIREICLCITSRITITPPACETLDIPTLSMEAAHDTFYRIYNHGERSGLVGNILKQLDFHPLSITLLATVAHHNKWGTDRLAKEWERQRTDILRTHHNKSLAATIELSLSSPMFRELGPDARELLGVVAFFPQGANENNLVQLFPTVPDRKNIFDKFCILSLTYRSNGFITMLAPLRNHLRPRDPNLSPLLCTTKDFHFSRLSVDVYPGKPGYEEAQWIASEDANVEHLLDTFVSIGANSNDIWDAYAGFVNLLRWHKPRLIAAGPKIEALPDDHPSKPQCLLQLSQLFYSIGSYAESKRVLTHTLKLWRERGNDRQAALTLGFLGKANRLLGLPKEGIFLVKEGLKACGHLRDTREYADTFVSLAYSLIADNQLDAAEETASQVIHFSQDKDEQYLVCCSHHVLGCVNDYRGHKGKAIDHFETAVGIASSISWHEGEVYVLESLVLALIAEGRIDYARLRVERARSLAANNKYLLGRVVRLQAQLSLHNTNVKKRSPRFGALPVRV